MMRNHFTGVTVSFPILIIVTAILILIIILAAGIIIWDRHTIKRTIDTLNRMLDDAINGSFTENTYDETRLSALEQKLNRFLCICLVSSKNLTTEKEKIKSLISDISHQTKTPLSNILLYSGLLAESNLSESDKYSASQIAAQSEKLGFLINSLVKTSRLETGIISLQPGKNEIRQLLADVSEEIKPKADAKNISITLDECEGSAVFDPKWTAEALYNILDNGVKYTPQNGAIRISVRSYEMFYRIDIADNGMGIAGDEQSKIFGRFYRSPKVSQYEGVGIGLFLVREIITSEHGYIKVASKEGKGSTFSVFLPIKPA